ncbi:MAG: pilus assembly protein [Lautropia sp.]|nr:pilus assembly protein [Lautropia sp.]
MGGRPRDRHGRRKSLGQGMTEYIVIVALVGVAAIGVYSFLGQSVRGATAGIALEISGKSAKAGTDIAKTASDNAVDRANRKTSLGNYHEGNNH